MLMITLADYWLLYSLCSVILTTAELSVASAADRVQQVLGFLFRQQPEPGRGPQEDGGGAPHGGGDSGLGHLQKL